MATHTTQQTHQYGRVHAVLGVHRGPQKGARKTKGGFILDTNPGVGAEWQGSTLLMRLRVLLTTRQERDPAPEIPVHPACTHKQRGQAGQQQSWPPERPRHGLRQ